MLLSLGLGSAKALDRQDPCSCQAFLDRRESSEEASFHHHSSVGPCLPFLWVGSSSLGRPCLDVLAVWWGPNCLAEVAVTPGLQQEADLACGVMGGVHLGTVET